MPSGSRSRPSPPAEAAPSPAALTAVPSDPPAEGRDAPVSRLGRWLPRLSGLVRFAYRVGGASALAAALVWWLLVRGYVLTAGAAAWAPALGLLLLFLVPAGAAWLLGLTLHDLLTLPETLRRSATVAASASREALRAERGGRLAGALGALWAARGFVLESRGAWAKAATAARLVRLAKLPFALGLAGLFVLNGPMIAAGLLALLLLLF